MRPMAPHSTVTLLARLLDLCRRITSLREVSGVQAAQPGRFGHSTVTLFARLRGLSTSVPRAQAVW